MATNPVTDASYLSPRQAALDASVSVRTLRRAITAGDLIAYRVGHQLRIPRIEFVKFVQRHRA